jgi:uracil-DNA glycosylase
MSFNFPFGAELSKVEQKDKTPKKVFVLGVYASAVHAKWIGTDGKVKVNAMAVASEPYIFWKGDDALKIVQNITIPKELGKLIPANKQYNGPSGNTLDKYYLEALGYNRKDAWLCDLLPYSRINPNQQKALDKHYNPIIKKFDLPECTIPKFSATELNNSERVDEIVKELEQSKAKTIILLGDLPIKYFLSHFSKYRKLRDFGYLPEDYGKKHKIEINGNTYKVLPLTHPRQAGKLGMSNNYWNECHEIWVVNQLTSRLAKMIEKKDPTQSKVTKKPRACPSCNSKNIASYIYDVTTLTPKLQKDIEDGKAIIGEETITKDSPNFVCQDCGKEFFSILK